MRIGRIGHSTPSSATVRRADAKLGAKVSMQSIPVRRLTPPARVRIAVVAVAYGIYLPAYHVINQASLARSSHHLLLPGEEQLPLLPAFALLYAVGFVLPLLPIWKAPAASDFWRAIVAFAMTATIAFLVFLAFPVCLERPAVAESQPWLRLAYLDLPCNAFPSLHVAICWLVFLACREGVRHHSVLGFLIVGISCSTVLVRQHYIVDVPAGLLLAVASWRAAGSLLTRRSHLKEAAAPELPQ